MVPHGEVPIQAKLCLGTKGTRECLRWYEDRRKLGLGVVGQNPQARSFSDAVHTGNVPVTRKEASLSAPLQLSS